MRVVKYLLVALFLVVGFSSCRILYPNQMFRQKDYQYFDMAHREVEGYLIQKGDQFTIQIFARDGFKLIDIIGGANSGDSYNRGGFQFTVDQEGFVKLPVLGDFFVVGHTETSLERVLAEKYATLFVDPWVSIKVNNRRAFVVRDGSTAIVNLTEVPISIIELIARGGGMDARTKAYKIKIIRGDVKNPQIYMVDLSTLEGVRNSDLTVQPNDIVILERRRQYVTDVLREITPYTSAVTTLLTLVILFRTRLGQ